MYFFLSEGNLKQNTHVNYLICLQLTFDMDICIQDAINVRDTGYKKNIFQCMSKMY